MAQLSCAGLRRLRLLVLVAAAFLASNSLDRGGLSCVAAQVLEEPRDQPADFFSRVRSRSSASRLCACSLQYDSDQLLRCLLNYVNSTSTREQLAGKAKKKSSLSSAYNITLVSYLTPDIFNYGAYSLALNTIFADYHQHAMHVEVSGEVEGGGDERWTKVRVILDLLLERHAQRGGGGDEGMGEEWLVWLDSDLVFLDMGLRLQQVLEEVQRQQQGGAQYDLIFSADSQVEMGVANSGLFLVKNTAWARDFLRRWLDMQTLAPPSRSGQHANTSMSPSSLSGGALTHAKTKTKATMMDQLALTQLYRSQLPGVEQHVRLLRPDALNSVFPAWLHQRPGNQVLHLAATSMLLRRRVFQQGLAAVCLHLHLPPSTENTSTSSDQEKDEEEGVASSTASELLPRQLGLSRTALFALRNDLPVEETILETSLTVEQRLLALRPTSLEQNWEAAGLEGTGAIDAIAYDDTASEDVIIIQLLRTIEDALRHGKRLQGRGHPRRREMHQRLLSALSGCYALFTFTHSLATPNSTTPHAAAARESGDVSRLHLLLVISFRYSLMLVTEMKSESSDDRGMDEGSAAHRAAAAAAEALYWAEPLLDEVLSIARGRGGRFLHEILFYKYKHLFVSAELTAQAEGGNERRALPLYERAMQVWWERHELEPAQGQHWDQQHIEPCSEAFETLYRLAVISCSPAQLVETGLGGNWQEQELWLRGLDNVTRSRALLQEVWGRFQASRWPEQVVVMEAKTLAAGGDCHRRLQQWEHAAQRYREAQQAVARLESPSVSFKQQTAPLLSYLTSSLGHIAVEIIKRGGGGEVGERKRDGQWSPSAPKPRHTSEEVAEKSKKKGKRMFRRRKTREL